MKFPTYEEMAQNVAEKALDEYEYNGKTLREWVEIISAIPVTAIPATDTNVATKVGTNLAEVGTDAISRQAAIDALNEYFDRIGKLKRRGLTKGKKAISLDTVGTIKTLPPAEPKRGKWILDRSGAYCCSECMEPCAGYVMMKPRDKFCKMCGSRNEVTE